MIYRHISNDSIINEIEHQIIHKVIIDHWYDYNQIDNFL